MSERPIIIPAVCYRDPLAALKWLEAAFGFETTVLITDAEGNLSHSEMGFRGGAIFVAGEWEGAPLAPARSRSPLSTGGDLTGFLRIHLDGGLDAHAERARAAGGKVLQEPEDQFYGDRIYRVLDPEGHVWTFSQPVRSVSDEEMERASGLNVRASLEKGA